METNDGTDSPSKDHATTKADQTSEGQRGPGWATLFLIASCVPIMGALCYLPRVIRALTNDSEGWASMFFRVLIAPAAAGYVLLVCVIPTAIMLWKDRSCRMKKISFEVSLGVLILIVISWISFEPLRVHLIFGR